MSSQSNPIDIDDFNQAIDDLPDDALISLKAQLTNSLAKLRSTNDQLSEEIKQLPPTEHHQDDIKLYSETILENEVVIQNQDTRIISLDKQLIKRGLLKQSSPANESSNDVNGNESNDTTSQASTHEGVYL